MMVTQSASGSTSHATVKRPLCGTTCETDGSRLSATPLPTLRQHTAHDPRGKAYTGVLRVLHLRGRSGSKEEHARGAHVGTESLVAAVLDSVACWVGLRRAQAKPPDGGAAALMRRRGFTRESQILVQLHSAWGGDHAGVERVSCDAMRSLATCKLCRPVTLCNHGHPNVRRRRLG
jgi:hypothetical protein